MGEPAPKLTFEVVSRRMDPTAALPNARTPR